MVWDNMRQSSITFNKSKVTMDADYKVSWIDGTSLSYMRSYNMNAVTISLSRMKPLGKYGTVGVGINYSQLFGKDEYAEVMPEMYSFGWNALYTNSFQITKQINYAPAIIATQAPLNVVSPTSPKELDYSTISKDFMGILSNSFTVQLTRRFSFNVGWTMIYSTNEYIPIMNSFMIGSKIPF